MEIGLTRAIDCLCDFTYDFYWQHRGSRLSPSGVIPYQAGTSYTYKDLVECLKRGEDVHIKGDAGKRLGSSLGVDLKFFGGTGRALKTGSIIVDGNVDTRMGISMVSGAIYVKGAARQPLGNIIEVESDMAGYHKYRSITGLLHEGLKEMLIPPNIFTGDCLLIKDGLLRDTLAARLDSDRKVIVEGDAGMSTAILMKRGSICVDGNAGMNAGVLLEGGMLTVKDAGEFAGAYMRDGILIISGNAQGYIGANLKGGTIFYRGKAMGKTATLDDSNIKVLTRLLGISRVEAMMFKKYGSF
ncbi:Tungsten-containing formylmethanofuran dehydrogenase 2 subunit C [uncultured archaeon]|nr:Tungsten-containing formylmethanofuran dehydrogenase 2 subunit C [uncultured archaeon]